MHGTARRASYVLLCALPFLASVGAAARPLRTPGVHWAIGAVLFIAAVTAAWTLGGRQIASAQARSRVLALAGMLFVTPWLLVSLLWVGIGAPFQATADENRMRFLMLLANSIIVSGAFVALTEALREAGERFYSTLGFAAGVPAGAAYLLCMSIISADYVATVRDGVAAGSTGLFSDVFDVAEFAACVLTYLATAAFATSLAAAGLLGRGAARIYAVACAVLVLLLAMRGVSYPSFTDSAAPWYTRVAWIAGIPAIPWIMPGLLGAVLLRRVDSREGP